jgi:hypothetical protein
VAPVIAPELSLSKAGKLKSALLPDLTTVICLGSEKIPGMFSWDEVLAMSDAVSEDQLCERQSEQQFDDPINIQCYLKVVDSFPMTVTGKIQKFLMRQESTEELGLQSAASIRTA